MRVIQYPEVCIPLQFTLSVSDASFTSDCSGIAMIHIYDQDL